MQYKHSFLVHVPMGDANTVARELFDNGIVGTVETVEQDQDGDQILRVQTNDRDLLLTWLNSFGLVITYIEVEPA